MLVTSTGYEVHKESTLSNFPKSAEWHARLGSKIVKAFNEEFDLHSWLQVEMKSQKVLVTLDTFS